MLKIKKKKISQIIFKFFFFIFKNYLYQISFENILILVHKQTLKDLALRENLHLGALAYILQLIKCSIVLSNVLYVSEVLFSYLKNQLNEFIGLSHDHVAFLKTFCATTQVWAR